MLTREILQVLARLCAVWSKEDSATSVAEDLAKVHTLVMTTVHCC